MTMVNDNMPNSNSGGSFDIFTHLHKLKPTKEKGKFECPVCNQENLSINMTTGAYQCFNGCDNAAIREWLSPWEKSEQRVEAKRPKSAAEIEKLKEQQIIADEFKLDKQVKRTLREYQDGVISKVDAIAHVESYARAHSINEYTARMMLRDRMKEADNPEVEEVAEAEAEFVRIEAANKENYPVKDVFHPVLANLILDAGLALDCPPELLIMPLWSCAASMIGTKIWIQQKKGFEQPCILWSAISALSGSKKSPAMDVIFDPLSDLQNQEQEKFKLLLEAYELEKQHYDGLDKGEKADTEPPRRPSARSYFIDDATMESICEVHSQDANKNGFLWAVDEVAGLFKGLDQYKGGKGNSKQRLLSLYDGKRVKINRVGKDSIFINKTAISILGSIQPSVLDTLIKDKTDADGLWSRFDIWEVPRRLMTMNDDEHSAAEVLTPFYAALDKLEPQTLVMSPEAAKFYKHYCNRKISYQQFPVDGAIANYIAKQMGRCLRRIGVLHCMDAAIEGVEPTRVVSLETAKRGVLATMAVIAHALNKASIGNGDNLTDEFLKIQEFCHRRSTVGMTTTARDIKRGIKAFKEKDSKEIESIFARLSSLGFGCTSKSAKQTLIYSAYVSPSENVKNDDQRHSTSFNVIRIATAGNETQQELQPIVTIATDFINNSENDKLPKTTARTPNNGENNMTHSTYTPKTGDKVRILPPIFKGACGTVIGMAAADGYVEVATEDGRELTLLAVNLELV